MSIKADLGVLVGVQRGELELQRIDGEITALQQRRAAHEAEIEGAQAVVDRAEKELEEARAAARRLEVDLQAAEDNVGKFKDHLLSVKTNKELWALQEEIATAEGAVSAVETRILEQLETADSVEAVIGDKRAELEATRRRVEKANVEIDRDQAALESEREALSASVAALRERLPADLERKYEGVKAARGGIGVAEALDEICLVCNFRMRPQLYVEIFNLEDMVQCENCKRILFVAERLDLPPVGGAVASDATSTSDATSDAVS